MQKLDLDIKQVRPLIRMAMEEDLGRGDVTTNLLFQDGTRPARWWFPARRSWWPDYRS